MRPSKMPNASHTSSNASPTTLREPGRAPYLLIILYILMLISILMLTTSKSQRASCPYGASTLTSLLSTSATTAPRGEDRAWLGDLSAGTQAFFTSAILARRNAADEQEGEEEEEQLKNAHAGLREYWER